MKKPFLAASTLQFTEDEIIITLLFKIKDRKINLKKPFEYNNETKILSDKENSIFLGKAFPVHQLNKIERLTRQSTEFKQIQSTKI